MKGLFSCLLVAVMVAVTMGGCTVGPDFRSPEFATPGAYTAVPLPAQTADVPAGTMTTQRFAFAEDLAAQWWTLFRSSELDGLIKRGLDKSPSLEGAQAALRKAQEDLQASSGLLFYPVVNGNLQATRQRTSENAATGPSNTFNLYNASVSVSYTLDLFGGSRRQREIYQAQVDYQQYLYEATYLTLTANLVTTAIQEASLRAQIAAMRDILAVQRKQLEVLKRQFELGAVTRTAVLSQLSEVAITGALLPPLEKQLDVTRHALSVLIGQFPGEGKLPEFHLDSLQLPETLPVSLPSELARQRPDIRASEALLHQACAAVGVATANLYPRITLSGGYGFQAVSTALLFNGQSMAWSLGAGLLQPIFRGGELAARRRSAIAAYDQAAAEYRQTVLKAFQNVADVLRALETDARTLQAQVEAEAAAGSTFDLIEKQYELGAVSYLSLLIAQRDYHKTRINVIAAQAQRYADTAALFQALGGGWWNRSSTSVVDALK
jgi:NodT family efflux transporter outer membrane factor (OMF) lipoprotein